MRIAVLGTGEVGRTLGRAFVGLGHDVVLGTRDPSRTLARADPPDLPLERFRVAVVGAGLVVNATSGAASLSALESCGHEVLADKVLLDVANPLDFSKGFPPSLALCNTESLGERLQRRFPHTRIVKSLNTVTAALMVDPGQLREPTSVFVSGNSAAAKTVVTGLLGELGWRDIIDLGGIETARGTEMYLPLWLRLMQASGSPMFNIRVVRDESARRATPPR